MVYAKRPFAGPEQVLDYVGRYTHRVAISNNRLVSMDNGKVALPLEGLSGRQSPEDHDPRGREFIRRFLIHVLPDGFHRIRYFGFLGNCHRAQKLAQCRELLGMATSRTGSRSARRLPRPVRGTDRAVVAGVPALSYRHHGGDRLHRAAQSLLAGSGHIMTRNRRSNCMNRNRRPDRDGVARPVTATRVPDHCQNSQTSSAMTARSPDCVGPSRQSADPERSDGASAKEAAPFNAHSLSGTENGLVQHVFPSPARILLRSPSAEASAARRRAKNAVRYAAA